MKTTNLRLAVLAVGLAVTANGAAPHLEFSGHMMLLDGERRFIVTDLTTGETSTWLSEGETFKEYTIGPFDPARATLSLHGEGGTVTLALKPSRVKPAEATAPPKRTAIEVRPHGGIAIDGQAVEWSSLPARLRALNAQQSKAAFDIRVPSKMDAKKVSEVIHRLAGEMKSVGITKFSFQLKNESPPPDPTPATPPERGI